MCMVMSWACFGPRHSNDYNCQCRASDILAIVTIFNVFSYDKVLSRDSNLSPPRRRVDALCVEPRSRVCIYLSGCLSLIFSFYISPKLKLNQTNFCIDVEKIHYVFLSHTFFSKTATPLAFRDIKE